MEVGAWRGKRAAEAARADEADAANVRLMAELDAARLQLQVLHRPYLVNPKIPMCAWWTPPTCASWLSWTRRGCSCRCMCKSMLFVSKNTACCVGLGRACSHQPFVGHLVCIQAAAQPASCLYTACSWQQSSVPWHGCSLNHNGHPDLIARTAGLTARPGMHFPQNMVPRAEAREARNAADARDAVEAAQAAAAAALAAELEVVRRGRADAEAREAALQEEVHPKHNCKQTPATVCAPTKQAAGVVICWQLAVPAEQDTGESPVQGFTTTKQQHQLRLAPVPPMSVWTCMAGALGVLHPFIAGCMRQCASVRESCCGVRV